MDVSFCCAEKVIFPGSHVDGETIERPKRAPRPLPVFDQQTIDTNTDTNAVKSSDASADTATKPASVVSASTVTPLDLNGVINLDSDDDDDDDDDDGSAEKWIARTPMKRTAPISPSTPPPSAKRTLIDDSSEDDLLFARLKDTPEAKQSVDSKPLDLCDDDDDADVVRAKKESEKSAQSKNEIDKQRDWIKKRLIAKYIVVFCN